MSKEYNQPAFPKGDGGFNSDEREFHLREAMNAVRKFYLKKSEEE